MNEFFARNRLSSYIDGALSPRENREMEQMFLESVEVRTAHSDMVRAVELVGKEGGIAPPVGLIDEIVALYQERPRERSKVELILRLVLLVTVGCAIVAAYYYSRHSGERVVDISAQRDQLIAAEADLFDSVPVDVPDIAPSEEEEVDSVLETVAVAPPVLPPSSVEVAVRASLPVDEVGPQSELDLTSTNEWEELWEGAGGEEAGELTVPSSYRFYAVDSGSLARIASLAHGVGASLLNRDGAAFETFRMSTERNFSNFLVRIPSESVESFLGELQLLGSLSVVPSDGVLLSPNGQVELGVQVQYAP